MIVEEEKNLPKAPSIGTYTWKDTVTTSVVASALRLAAPAEALSPGRSSLGAEMLLEHQA